jgi:hypothetical protein
VAGTSSPSAFAVLRLIISSNFVGRCTGRSAGLAPLRMRCCYPVASAAMCRKNLAGGTGAVRALTIKNYLGQYRPLPPPCPRTGQACALHRARRC